MYEIIIDSVLTRVRTLNAPGSANPPSPPTNHSNANKNKKKLEKLEIATKIISDILHGDLHRLCAFIGMAIKRHTIANDLWFSI